MDVSDICRREIVSLGADATPQSAAQAMRREHVGTVVVTDPRETGRVMGILTDRDLVIDVMAAGRPAEAGTIGELCHADLVSVSVGASLRDAAEAMREAAVRRLFVMQADGGVLGVLSIDDVVEAMAGEFGALAGALREGIERERERTEGAGAGRGPRALYPAECSMKVGRRRKAAPHLPARVHSIPVTGEDTLVPDETLAETESELGQNEWIDPEAGELAEGEAPPRLEEE